MKNTAPKLGLWALLLGGTGFAAGFFGPILLNPEANQGPLLGIIITGPGGAAIGFLLGLVFKWLAITPRTKWLVLVGTNVVGGIVILVLCLPGPKTIGYVIDGRVTQCVAPAERMHEAINYWDKRIEATPWGKVRAEWKQDTQRMLRDEGVVLDVTTTREANILEHRKPWNRGKLTMSAWHEPIQQRSYFARFNGSSCSAYQENLGLLYVATEQGSADWPPTDLQNFLGLALIDPLPGRYRALMD